MKNYIYTLPTNNWHTNFDDNIKMQAINALEEGKVLFFPQLPFNVLDEESHLLSPHWSDKKSKNISYSRPIQSLNGTQCNLIVKQQLSKLLARFSQSTENFIHQLLPSYQTGLMLARTSFRPTEIADRRSSYRKDDTRLHVDAFPSSPNQGKRILRVFSNINRQDQPRVWRLGEPFTKVAQRFLPSISAPFSGSHYLMHKLRLTRSQRTYYDHIMLQIHNRMKKDINYQQQAEQLEFHFPAGCSWIVMTDHVSHAAMRGQYVLEQTFYLPTEYMADEQRSPLRTLERLTGETLT